MPYILCKDCAHYQRDPAYTHAGHDLCTRLNFQPPPDRVRGQPVPAFCSMLRRDGNLCGPDGRGFTAAPSKEPKP